MLHDVFSVCLEATTLFVTQSEMQNIKTGHFYIIAVTLNSRVGQTMAFNPAFPTDPNGLIDFKIWIN